MLPQEGGHRLVKLAVRPTHVDAVVTAQSVSYDDMPSLRAVEKSFRCDTSRYLRLRFGNRAEKEQRRLTPWRSKHEGKIELETEDRVRNILGN